jgi:hypothetical protein
MISSKKLLHKKTTFFRASQKTNNMFLLYLSSIMSLLRNKMQAPFCDGAVTVKKVNDFPVPSRDVTNQTLSGRELLNYSRPGRIWYVTSWLGSGKSGTFFHSVPAAL